MDKQTETTSNDSGTIAENARALMTATADVAGEKVSEARKCLAAALESGKKTYGRVREQTVAGTKVADQTVRENPYQAIAIAIGVGAILGYLISHRCSKSCE